MYEGLRNALVSLIIRVLECLILWCFWDLTFPIIPGFWEFFRLGIIVSILSSWVFRPLVEVKK